MTERAMSRIPEKYAAGPLPPLQRPLGMAAKAENGRSWVQKAAPFALLLALVPLVLGALRLFGREKSAS